MKTLIAAVAPFAQSVNAWGWKGALAAQASAKSADAASFNGPRRVIRGGQTYARNCNVSPASLSYRTNCN